MENIRRKPISNFKVILFCLLAIFKIKKTTLTFLKCDAKGCIHIEYYDRLDETLIDKPCPVCNSNLLTKEDYFEYNGV